MQLSLSLHILGIVFWLGTMILLPSLLKTGAKGDGVSQFVRRSWFGFALPGALITILTGLYQFGTKGSAYYFSQGWFHGKLTLIILLLVITFIMFTQVSAFRRDEPLSRVKLVIVHAGTSTILLLIALLTFRVLI